MWKRRMRKPERVAMKRENDRNRRKPKKEKIEMRMRKEGKAVN